MTEDILEMNNLLNVVKSTGKNISKMPYTIRITFKITTHKTDSDEFEILQNGSRDKNV